MNYLNPDAELDLSNHYDKRTRQEINKYDAIGEEGDISDGTLRCIFKAYMDRMVAGLDLSESNFVPLKHAGCGAFNPVFDIRQSEEENRRVTFFLLDGHRLPVFPCAQADLTPCKRQIDQFDAESGTFRHHREFRCCFYDSLAKECKGEVTVPDIIAIDAHMHFMSGHCTPLPLLWNQLPTKPHLRRTALDNVGGWALRHTLGPLRIPKVSGLIKGTYLQRQSTLEIAVTGMNQNQSVYPEIYKGELGKSLGRRLFTPMVAMCMDMAYAHMDGYKGMPIYQRVNERYYFYYEAKSPTGETEKIKMDIWPDEVCEGRNDLLSESKAKKIPGLDLHKESYVGDKEGFYFFHARLSEEDDSLLKDDKKRTPVWLHRQEMDLFEDWEAQKLATIAAAIKYPLQYMPMYHYDPRRWSRLENSHRPDSAHYDAPQNWDVPFDDVVTPKKPGVFIGFKMYTALGYKPLDKKLSKTQSQFYKKCEAEGIPVLCHCSPSGMYSHDRELYFDLESDAFKSQYKKKKLFGRRGYNVTEGFYDEFGSPTAWESQVLDKFPNLKLCLAHFGGGSSYWKEWAKDTVGRDTDYRRKRKKELQNSNVRMTLDEEDRLVSEWYYNKQRKNEKPKEGIPNQNSWIRDIVEIMAKEDGKKYPNFYTDISFHFVEDHKKQFFWLLRKFPFIKDRIMFGTDWYMTELDNWSINKFVIRTKNTLYKMSAELELVTGERDDLWERFTRENPMKFYGIRGIADSYAVGLRNAETKNKDKFVRKFP